MLADGHFVAGANEAGDVGLRGVVGDAAHGNGLALLAIARSEGDLKLAGGDDRVFVEKLVKIAEAEEKQGLGMLPLDGVVLLHQRRGWFGHSTTIRAAAIWAETEMIIAGRAGFGNSEKGIRDGEAFSAQMKGCVYTAERAMAAKREIEVKLRVSDVAKLVARLRSIGARRTARVHEENTLFDTEDRQLGAKRAILRIRREQDADASGSGQSEGKGRSKGTPIEGLLTFKGLVEGQTGVRARYKEREEIEFRLKDAERFAGVLRRIGMRPWFAYEKYRTKYRTKDPRFSIDLDETPIGVFLELEGPRRAIDRAARALGYSSDDYITASYLELYKVECSRKGSKVANMVFPKKKKR